MSESRPPTSSEPPPPPTGGTGYIVLVALLLAAIGGIVYWKLKGSEQSAPAVSAPPVQTTPPPQFVEPPPPPPPLEQVEQPDGSAPPKVGTAQAYSPCNASTCSGTASSALQAALSQRAAGGRRCYERALRVNSGLQGRMTVVVRVDNAGNVCSASVAQDEIHSNEVTTCLLSAFRSAKLPPATGGCVDIKVPLSFVPQGK